jgi:pilus assembly protein Flp/PilA
MLQIIVALQALRGRLTNEDEGATAVEYGLMVALIAVAIILAVTAVGDNLVLLFEEVADNLAL